MSVLWMCGFEAGELALYSNAGMSATYWVTTADCHKTLTGAGGTYAAYVPGGHTMTLPSIGTTTGRFAHFYYKLLSNQYFQLSFYAPADPTPTNTINIADSGVASVYRGNFATLLATAAVAIPGWAGGKAAWFAVENVAKDAPNGVLTLWLDGVQYVTAPAGADTQGSGTVDWDRFSTYSQNYLSGGNFDDIIITDINTGRLGEWFLQRQVPDLDVACALAPTPPGAGINYARVSEIPASQAQFNDATALLQEDVYGTSNPATAPITVLAVCAWAWCTRDGTITQARTGIEEGGITAYRAYAALPVAGTWQTIWQIADLNPSTGLAWTPAEINNLRLHIQFN